MSDHNANAPPPVEVLVTRPEHQAKRLGRLIVAAGGEPHMVPVLEILPAAQPDAVLKSIGEIEQYDLFIFVSTNAVRFGRDYLPADHKLPGQVAAIGPATANALIATGFGCDITPGEGYASEDLLRDDALADMRGKHVLIVRGEGGRELLGDTLRERGAEVSYAQVYRRRPPKASFDVLRRLLDEKRIDIVTATSVETLGNVVDMAGDERRDRLRQITVLTASPRVVKKAAELGFEHPALLAKGSDDKSLVRALNAWRAETVDDNSHSESAAAPTSGPETTAMGSNDDKALTVEGPDATAAGAADHVPVAADTPPQERVETPAPAPPAKAVKSGRGLAALALLVGLVAAAAGAYNGWQDQSLRNELDEVGGRIPDSDSLLSGARAELAKARAENEAAAQSLTQRVESRLARIDLSALEDVKDEQQEVSNRVRGQDRSINTLTNRLSGLEQDLSALQGVSATVRNTWVRAEAEYFLQTANSRLQLAQDVESALQALRAADERIGALGDPGLTPVRALLTEEILAVEDVPRPDVEGMTIMLNGMAGRIATLPIKHGGPGSYVPDRGELDDNAGGLERAKSVVAEVFTSIVRVSPSDGTSVEFMAPEEVYFLVRNLELQLQVARVALMQKDQQNFTGSLESAGQWLRDYFDTEDSAVSTMLTRLTEMQNADIDPDVPDISGSLRLLREIVAASGASQ